MDVSFTPFAVMLKLLISQVKKQREFKLLFKDLASTMEILVPLVEEIDTLLKRLGRGNKHLRSLHKTMRRADQMLHKCSRVGKCNLPKKNWCTKEIKEIIADFEKFSRRSMPFILLLNQLRSSLPTSLNMADNSNISTGRASLDEDEQFAATVQESLYMQESPPGIEDVHRVILEYFSEKGKGKQVQADEQLVAALNMDELSLREADQELLRQGEDKGKGKQVQADEQIAVALNMEELSLRQADQKSISLPRVAKSRVRELESDEQIAKAWQFYESERITNGSTSSTGGPLDDDDVQEQQVIWESYKK